MKRSQSAEAAATAHNDVGESQQNVIGKELVDGRGGDCLGVTEKGAM